MLNIRRPLYSVLGYKRTIMRININILLNIGPGVGGGGEKEALSGNIVAEKDLKKPERPAD